ncbi:MAG TPA: alanine dehydrogenase [Caldithrix abyssi]|uniref:Alanine dehydrogenase n=1 Tax=Caldithrix abyssi TaxID=187145 RepID=A0A7V4TZU8_CALAY|nr:alanine dehydrogenase [Caldithrix abyssi]
MLKVGLLREIKAHEGRVMLTPEGVKVLVKNGITVFVESDAGLMCNYENLEYERAGAQILPTMEKVFAKSELILQVQPPSPIEYDIITPSHILVSFLNLIHSADRLKALLKTKATFISAELIQDDNGKYPLLMGMSEIAGKISIHVAQRLLSIIEGGKGKLLGGTELTKPATITIVGSGKVGRTAALHGLANGARVNLISLKEGKLEAFAKENPQINTFLYSQETLNSLLPETDVLIVAVYSLKDDYDITISREQINLMEKGSVVIDISVEQIKTVETSHITSHEQPSFIVDGIVHYCVPNIAAAVPVTASRILTKRILPIIKSLALKGLKDSLIEFAGLIPALNIYKGKVTNRFYADHFGYEFYNIFELLELNL